MRGCRDFMPCAAQTNRHLDFYQQNSIVFKDQKVDSGSAFVRLTAGVTRWWAGRDNATLPEPRLSQEKCPKTRRLPPVGCTLCWVAFAYHNLCLEPMRTSHKSNSISSYSYSAFGYKSVISGGRRSEITLIITSKLSESATSSFSAPSPTSLLISSLKR